MGDNKGRGIRRTAEQLEKDRRLIARIIYMNPDLSTSGLQEAFRAETGRSLSKDQVMRDTKRIREAAVADFDDSYARIIVDELTRLDVNEAILWEELGARKEMSKVREVINSQAPYGEKLSADEIKEYASSVTATFEGGKMDMAVFDRIMKIQKERRDLMKLFINRKPPAQAAPVEVTKYEREYNNASTEDWD